MSNRRITLTPPAANPQKEAPTMSQQPLTTRQERIDVACAIGIVAILLLLAGYWLHAIMAPTPAAASEPPATVATQAAVTAPAAMLHHDAPAVTTAAAAARCEEDMPCWDCRTMGNGICGPLLVPAVAAVTPDSPADEGEQIDAAELAELGATMEPCAFDEAAGPACYWDASTRGNQQGESFIWTGSELVYAAK